MFKKLTLTKIKTFIKSLLFHIGAGFPKSSQELINQRFNICNLCERFDSKAGECMECGCNINKNRVFLNKLAWADQECPLKKWLKQSNIDMNS